jgi:hypothetical protein
MSCSDIARIAKQTYLNLVLLKMTTLCAPCMGGSFS